MEKNHLKFELHIFHNKKWKETFFFYQKIENLTEVSKVKKQNQVKRQTERRIVTNVVRDAYVSFTV